MCAVCVCEGVGWRTSCSVGHFFRLDVAKHTVFVTERLRVGELAIGLEGPDLRLDTLLPLPSPLLSVCQCRGGPSEAGRDGPSRGPVTLKPFQTLPNCYSRGRVQGSGSDVSGVPGN